MTSLDRQPGWYDDPEDSKAQRYWDGNDWTPYRQRKATAPAAEPPRAPIASPPRSFQPPPPPPTASPLPPSGPPQAPPNTLPPPTGAPLPPGSAATPGAGALSPDNLAAVKAALTNKPSGAGVLLYIGLFVTAISVFLAWETVTVSADFLGTQTELFSGSRGTSSGFRFVILIPIALAAWLAWPVLTRTALSVQRLLGLTAVVVLMLLSVPLWFVVFRDNDPDSGTTSSYGFGLYLFAAAVVVVTVGVVRVWTDRSRASTQAY